MQKRNETRRVFLRGLPLGGGAPVSVQTMANANPHDKAALAKQISSAYECGADIVRLTIPDKESAEVLRRLLPSSPLPIVADIHFDHRLALAAIDAGVDALRINPGNIGGEKNVEAVVEAARPRRIPIRIGVNAGSLEKDLWEKYGAATPEALCESAARHVAMLEALDYREIVLSAKASDIPRTLTVYRMLSERFPYPLHLGLTEAGTFIPGTVRSCVALGALLQEGIGDTIRISLTGEPDREVRVGLELLRSLGLREAGAAVTSCPTCGRTKVDVEKVAEEVEKSLARFYRENPNAPRPHIAVMGCVVNGPGEAKEADIAVAGGDNCFALYRKGVFLRKIAQSEAIDAICELARQWQ